MSNPNLLREVRLYENSAERERMENLSELFAVLTALECLEKMYIRDHITARDYTTECYKLLGQYEGAMRLCQGTDVQAFVQKYRLQVPAALKRISDGRPLTIRSEGNLPAQVAEIVSLFVTYFDAIKLNVRAVDELFPTLNDLYNCIMKIGRLPDNSECKQRIKKWYDRMSQMSSASDNVTDEEARQMLFELEGAYNMFNTWLAEEKH